MITQFSRIFFYVIEEMECIQNKMKDEKKMFLITALEI